jgi:very-short-patch-repair endonuclease
MAAVLACGPHAVLSHISAAELWGMLRSKRRPSPASSEDAAHVTVPTQAGRRPRHGIVVHRSGTLVPSQVTRRLGVLVTTPSRTLADLRRALPPKRFAAALREAEFLGLPLEPDLDPDGTRSEMEALFLGLCRRHRVPRPWVNVRIGGHDVDFLWPDRRLAVEVDGWDSHRTRSAFEEDRARDLKLKLLGFEVVRFTWRRLTESSGDVAAALRRLLGAEREMPDARRLHRK